jgi:hypothetical protein
MKIFNEREQLYDQLEKEGAKMKKNSSAEPVIRGHLSQKSNILTKDSPYQAGVNMGMVPQ